MLLLRDKRLAQTVQRRIAGGVIQLHQTYRLRWRFYVEAKAERPLAARDSISNYDNIGECAMDSKREQVIRRCSRPARTKVTLKSDKQS